MTGDVEAPGNGKAGIREVFAIVTGMEQRLIERIDRLEDAMRDEQKREIARLEGRIKTDEKIGWIGSILAALAAAAIAAHQLIGR